MNKQPATEMFLKGNWKAGDVFIDVGAGIGYFTFMALDYLKRRGMVIAIEADPYNYDRLKIENDLYAMLHGRSATLLNIAADVGHGFTLFYRSETNRGLSSACRRKDREFQELKVRMVPLDMLFGNPPFFTSGIRIGMKVDVEGCEKLVLAGAREIMKKVDYIAVDYHQAFDVRPIEITEEFEMAGLTTVEVDHPERRNELFAIRSEK